MRVSYVSEITWFSKCPFCGFEHSKLMEKRSIPRLKERYASSLKYKNNIYYGHTIDLSSKGVRILYEGEVLDSGNILELVVEELDTRVKAEVVWSKQVTSDKSHVGLRVI